LRLRLAIEFYSVGIARNLRTSTDARQAKTALRPHATASSHWDEGPHGKGTIYAAATDDSEQLRHIVGEDAKAFAGDRARLDDQEYFAHMAKQFGL